MTDLPVQDAHVPISAIITYDLGDYHIRSRRLSHTISAHHDGLAGARFADKHHVVALGYEHLEEGLVCGRLAGGNEDREVRLRGR